MQTAAGAGRIPVDLENEHDSLMCVFPFTEGFRVAALRSVFYKIRERQEQETGCLALASRNHLSILMASTHRIALHKKDYLDYNLLQFNLYYII